MTADSEPPPPAPGLLATLRAVPAQLVAMLVTRGELASLELGESRDRLLRTLALYAAAAVLALAGLMTVSLWVAALFWDGPRALALGLLALLYGVGAGALVLVVRRELAAAPPLLAQTLAELRKDREALAPSDAPPAGPAHEH